MGRRAMLRNMKYILLILAALLMVSCAEENNDEAVSPADESTPLPGPYVPPGSSTSDQPGVVWESGGTASVTLEGHSTESKVERLSEYAGESRNNPTDIALNVNLVRRGNGYGGRITLGYYDGSTYHEGVFVNGDEYVFWSTSLESAAKYNVWFEKNGNEYFHGFFQDRVGGFIIVIEGFESLGDGEPPINARGSLWFKNFSLVQSPYVLEPFLPPTHCWLISTGPFDCRTWKSGKGVETTALIHPIDGYKKLGTFSGLNINDAFNGEEIVFKN